MKKYLFALLLTVSPLLIFAVGIPDENKKMILTITAVGITIVLLALTIVSVSVALMSKGIFNPLAIALLIVVNKASAKIAHKMYLKIRAIVPKQYILDSS